MYIAPGRGRQSIGDKILMTTERSFLFAHMLQVSKWSLRNLILYTFLMILYKYYSPGARAENPLGTNFWCQQKALITSTICCKFQTYLFEFWFYIHFLMFFHIYIAPGQGQTTLCGQNPDVNRKALSFLPICCKFPKKYLWSLILYIIFHVFIHVYSPGAGADNPLVWEFLYKHKRFVTLVICCKFLPLNDFLTVFPI